MLAVLFFSEQNWKHLDLCWHGGMWYRSSIVHKALIYVTRCDSALDELSILHYLMSGPLSHMVALPAQARMLTCMIQSQSPPC